MRPASSELFPPIPPDTANAARFVFSRSNFYFAIGNHANHLFSGLILNYPFRGAHHPDRTMAMLYLITIFQFVDTLSDSQAADALQYRVDWKYALHLPLSYRGLDGSILCKFRQWLLVNRDSQSNLQRVLARLAEITMVARKRALCLQTNTLVQSVCLQNRVEMVWLAVSEVLGALAIKNPEWLYKVTLPHWYERYGQQRTTSYLAAESLEQEALAQAIGLDGAYLLKMIADAEMPELENLPGVSALKRVWREQYLQSDENISWRNTACAGCTSNKLSLDQSNPKIEINRREN